MKLTSIKLVNFKNYSEATFHFDKKIISIVGNNGVGKTNLLDAIYYTCIGKSNFQASDKLIVKSDETFFRLESHYSNEEEKYQINIKIRPGSIKELEVNGSKVTKLSEHIGLIPVVIICPDDILNLLTGNEERRNFVNNTIIQYDKIYLHHLNQYTKLLKQRNALLKDFTERKYYDHDLLEIITEKMNIPAHYISDARRQFESEIKEPLNRYGLILSDGKENLSLHYKTKLQDESFLKLSENKLAIDRVTCRTNSGVHKDEIDFLINDQLIKDFGSQGQLKTFVFALKLAQYHLLHQKTTRKPIFLLDDVFDKLDKHRVGQLLNLLIDLDVEQVFITSTDKSRIGILINDDAIFEEFEVR